MRRKKVAGILLAVCLMGTLLSCGEEKDNGKKSYVEDMNVGHIQFDLTEKIHVNADITAYDRYKDGMSAYYTKSYVDMSNVFNQESLEENVKLFKQDVQTVVEAIEKNMDGNFQMDRMNIVFDETEKECWLELPHVDSEGVERVFAYLWYLGEDGNAHGPEVWLQNWGGQGEATSTEHYIGRYIAKYVPECRGEDLSFAGAEETAAWCKAELEKIMGEELSEDYICIPVNEENYNIMLERIDYDIDDCKYDEEFYQFFFFRSIDGFPQKRLTCDIFISDVDVLSEELKGCVVDNAVWARDEWPLVIDVDKSGIRFMEISANTDTDGVYREKESVIDINELIEKVKEYFATSYQKYDITIYNMELCYGGYFSDSEDGPVKDITSPFWIVDYGVEYYKTEGVLKQWDEANRLVFDAYTGEFVRIEEAVE